MLKIVFRTLALASAIAACASDRSGASAPSAADAGLADAAAPDAGGPSGKVYDGAPIEAEKGKWTWVSFSDSSCANGSPAGLGIHPGTGSTLLFYLEGGGVCSSEETCFGPNPTAIRMNEGVDADDLTWLGSANGWVFDRAVGDSPFKDASIVYVPYCTGDFHIGVREHTYGEKTAKHVGRKNIEAFLQRLVPTFESATRVVLAGTSAGGFGAYLNYARVRDAFAPTRVDLVVDAAPPLPKESAKPLAVWRELWDLQSNFPPDCTGCADSFDAALPYYLQTSPSSRFALLSSTADSVVAGAFQLTTAEFTTTLGKLAAERYDASPRAEYFFVPGDDHGLLDTMEIASGGTTLAKWLSAMQSDATWPSVGP